MVFTINSNVWAIEIFTLNNNKQKWKIWIFTLGLRIESAQTKQKHFQPNLNWKFKEKMERRSSLRKIDAKRVSNQENSEQPVIRIVNDLSERER